MQKKTRHKQRQMTPVEQSWKVYCASHGYFVVVIVYIFAPGEQSWQVVRASHGVGHGRTRKPRRAGRSSPSPGDTQGVLDHLKKDTKQIGL